MDRGGLVRRAGRIAGWGSAAAGACRGGSRTPLAARVGAAVIAASREAMKLLAFLGEASVAFMRLPTGRARSRRSRAAPVAPVVSPGTE